MKIGVLSDIHGNYAALQAVLNEAKSLGIEHWFVLGDVVGYYYHVDLVIDALAGLSHELIRGNHEEMLGRALEDPSAAQAIKDRYGSGIELALKMLPAGTIRNLISLPEGKMVDYDGVRFQLCHGAPWDSTVYLYPDSSTQLFDRCLTGESHFVLVGHSHYPFVYANEQGVLANVGSVGQARDKGGFASWAMISTANRSLVFRRTPYNQNKLIAEVAAIDPHLPYLRDVLSR